MRYLNIFANCQMVRGFNYSLMMDLQMNKHYHLPNDLCDVLDFLRENPIEEAYTKFGKGNKSTINAYIKFLVDQDLGFIDDRIVTELIPLPIAWDNYSEITNVLIDYNPALNYQNEFFKDLLDMHISAFEFRVIEDISEMQLRDLLHRFEPTTVQCIRFVLKYSKWMTPKVMEKLVKKYVRVNHISIHSAHKNHSQLIFQDSVVLGYFKAVIDPKVHCGIISSAFFRTNLELFSESQEHNTCLNRKLSIDETGNIKNCPSMSASFGNMESTSLSDVLNNADFKKDWKINKDSISVCKDCEFRHICSDCRAFLEEPKDNLSKPLKCGYDPYQNEWTDWSQNPLKQKAIKFYGLDQYTHY